MQNRSTHSEDLNRKKNELAKLLGHHSEEFARIAHSNNDFVANYLLGFLGEGDLRLLQENEYLQDLANGLVALKWQFIHGINHEISYAKLHTTLPTTQLEFNAVLNELLLLTKTGDSNN
ncbi:hypothetical protein [Runella sp.]|uniref:hypothetical protein n=1 Tax=Runella sp. TaxID=1960881 RepID=UPI003D0D46D0